MRRVIILALCFLIFRTLVSCCRNVEGFNYRWTSIKAENRRLDGSRFMPLTADSVKASNYGIILNSDYERLSLKIPSGLGLSEGLACKPNPYYNNLDTLRSLDLITVNAFDATHPAGSSLADLPLVPTGGSDTSRAAHQPTGAVMHMLNSGDDDVELGLAFSFRWTTPFLGPHRFVAKATTVSGRVLQDSVSVRFY